MQYPALLLLLLWLSGTAIAQQPAYNRWETRTSGVKPGASAAAAAPSGAVRGAAILAAQVRHDSLQLLVRLRQDSLRYAHTAAPPRLVRGLGQRLATGQLLAEDAAYTQFLRRNLHYPELALRSGMEGKVTVQLELAADGTVVGSRVLNRQLTQLSELEQMPIRSSAKLQAAAQQALWQQTRILLRQLVFAPGPGGAVEELTITYSIQ